MKELRAINELYRELSQFATVSTKREVSLQCQLDRIYMTVEKHGHPGELPIDTVQRLLAEGIAAVEARGAAADADTRIKWAAANNLHPEPAGRD